VVATTQFVTEGCASYAEGVIGGEEAYFRAAFKKGAILLHRAGVETRSDDLLLLAYLVYKGVSELLHQGKLDEDYLVAGDVLDLYVTDHDAELLASTKEGRA
jgi:hypothetical protein